DVATHGLEVAGDARLLPEAHVAADAGQRPGLHAVAAFDVAADGARVLDAGAVADPDVAADGLEVAVALAGLGGDVAADAVDVLLCVGRKRQAGGKRGGEGGDEDAVAAHGGFPVV